jgi:hypothetical protein
MAITIVATSGSASANSYASEAEAVAYAETRMNRPSTWTTISGSSLTDTEKVALIEATRELDRLKWKGTRVDETQRLEWPRKWVVNIDAPSPAYPDEPLGYTYYDEDEVPLRIREATIELAFEFLRLGTTDLAGLAPNIEVLEKTVDVLTTKFAEVRDRPTGLARFPRIVKLIYRLLLDNTGMMIDRV